ARRSPVPPPRATWSSRLLTGGLTSRRGTAPVGAGVVDTVLRLGSRLDVQVESTVAVARILGHELVHDDPLGTRCEPVRNPQVKRAHGARVGQCRRLERAA